MPNWCYNSIEVSGDPAEVAAFSAFLTENAARTGITFSFKWIVPQPPEPEPEPEPERVDYDCIDSPEAMQTWLNGLQPKPRQTFDWYSWNVENWGTKWDACDNVRVGSVGESKLEITFETAWTPPEPVVEAMAKRWTQLAFLLHYGEPGCDFGGHVAWENGVCVEDKKYAYADSVFFDPSDVDDDDDND